MKRMDAVEHHLKEVQIKNEETKKMNGNRREKEQMRLERRERLKIEDERDRLRESAIKRRIIGVVIYTVD